MAYRIHLADRQMDVWQAYADHFWFDKHMPCNQLIVGTDQDEVVWSGWPEKVLDSHHIFCTKHFFNWKKTHDCTYCFTINENLKNLFHQEFTLDYDCFCGYIYNSTSMDICHICQLKYITDGSGFQFPSEWWFYNIISKAGTFKRHQPCPKMCFFFISDTFHDHNYGAKK